MNSHKLIYELYSNESFNIITAIILQVDIGKLYLVLYNYWPIVYWPIIHYWPIKIKIKSLIAGISDYR